MIRHSVLRTKTQKKKLMKRICERWQLYLLLLLPVLVVFIFSYVPMVGIVMAFQKYNIRGGLFHSPFVGLKQFEKFLTSHNFWSILRNTLSISVYTLLVGFPLPVLFALLLNSMRAQRYKKVIQTVTYVPHFVSTVVMVGLVFQVLNSRNGLYGSMGRLLTGSLPPDLLAKGEYFNDIYVWSGIWQNLGFNAIIYIAALAGTDPNLHEAATIDGANRFQRMRYVDFPSILPTVSIMLIMRVGKVMSVGRDKALLMQNSLNMEHSEIISTYVYKVGLASGISDFSYSTAIGLFNSVVNITLLIIANKITKKLNGSGIF